MQGRTIYRLEPRLKSLNKADGHFWVPNSAITEHALTRRLGELDKEKMLFQADFRYRQREIQKELRNIRASKPKEPVRRSESGKILNRRNTDGPNSLTETIAKYKRKRTDQEYIQDLLRQRRDSLVSSINSKSGRSPVLAGEDTDDSYSYDLPDTHTGTVLDDMRSALALQPGGSDVHVSQPAITSARNFRKAQEPRMRRPTDRDATFPRGLTRRGSKRNPRDTNRPARRVERTQTLVNIMHPSMLLELSTGDTNDDFLDYNNSLVSEIRVDNCESTATVSDRDATATAMVSTALESGTISKTNEKEWDDTKNATEGFNLQREEAQITRSDINKKSKSAQRRCSEPVIVANRFDMSHLYYPNGIEVVSEETMPGIKEHVIRRRCSENDKYQCNFIKDLVGYSDVTTHSDGDMSESDVIWDDVRRCRYLRGYDPPDMVMPEEEINTFVFGRNENDILQLRREKPLE